MAMESRRLRISGVLGPRLHGGRTECLEGSPSEHRGTPVIERSAFRDGITSWPEYRRTGVDFGSAPIPDPNRGSAWAERVAGQARCFPSISPFWLVAGYVQVHFR